MSMSLSHRKHHIYQHTEEFYVHIWVQQEPEEGPRFTQGKPSLSMLSSDLLFCMRVLTAQLDKGLAVLNDPCRNFKMRGQGTAWHIEGHGLDLLVIDN